MQVITSVSDYEPLYQQWKDQTIALVPTMGALHDGHAALIRKAGELADKVVVSIFVNPLQFGPNEDLDRYPRPKEQDLQLCVSLNVAAVFYPTVETMYPEGQDNVTTVVPPVSMTDCLCGRYRPGHFTGVATVVLKLLDLIRPHIAIFGEKDAQQLAIIRKMVRDLQVPVDIVGHPIVRDGNGLALSSRNQYLKTDSERQLALGLHQILSRIQSLKLAGQQDAAQVLEQAHSFTLTELEAALSLSKAKELFRLQYLEVVDAKTLQPVSKLESGNLVLIAAYVGDVRLIDNWVLQ